MRQQRISRGCPILAALPAAKISQVLKQQEPAVTPAEGVEILTSRPDHRPMSFRRASAARQQESAVRALPRRRPGM